MERISSTVTVVVDVKGQATALRQPAFRLKVLKGADARREKRGAAPRLLIGTGAGADFALTDDAVSSAHCEIVCDEAGFRVRDLGSKNGVYLGDRRVLEAWLQPLDELSLGRSVLKFEVLDESEERPLVSDGSFGRLAGSSVRMRDLYAQLKRAAASDAAVLLLGETGTGKDLAAEALIAHGSRKDAPVVVVDCARLVSTLAESELFGHEQGAFTGATAAHAGAFERAHPGTVYLDHVGELPKELQAKLLGVLERRQVTRIGGARPLPLDVRIISSSARELERDVNAGVFRADLFYRLSPLQIRLPALREHREDIPELVSSMLAELPGGQKLVPALLQRLYDGEYGGNVRELHNAVERAVLGIEPAAASPVALTIDVQTRYSAQKQRLISSFERAYFRRMLTECSGNVSEIARRSGLNRMHVHELLRRLDLKSE